MVWAFPCRIVYGSTRSLVRRAVGHGTVPVHSNMCTQRARAGCPGVPSRVLRTRDRCAPLPSLTHAFAIYCVLQISRKCIWRIIFMPAARLSGAASGGTTAHAYTPYRMVFGTYCTLQNYTDCICYIACTHYTCAQYNYIHITHIRYYTMLQEQVIHRGVRGYPAYLT